MSGIQLAKNHQHIPLAVYMRHRHRRRAVSLIAALIVIAVLLILSCTGHSDYLSGDMPRYHGRSFDVVRVIDGDTIDVRIADGDQAYTRVRLWGVDTPELARDGRAAEDLAQEASDFAKKWAQGQQVTLWLEPHRLRGRYGRVLAYVELPDGSLLNARLIQAGLSPADNRWSHSRAQAFDELEHQAWEEKIGLWGP